MLCTMKKVYSEYENIYKNKLDDEFIIYFDDLDFDGVKKAAFAIKKTYHLTFLTLAFLNLKLTVG